MGEWVEETSVVDFFLVGGRFGLSEGRGLGAEEEEEVEDDALLFVVGDGREREGEWIGLVD